MTLSMLPRSVVAYLDYSSAPEKVTVLGLDGEGDGQWVIVRENGNPEWVDFWRIHFTFSGEKEMGRP